jgi:hypothetical protein
MRIDPGIVANHMEEAAAEQLAARLRGEEGDEEYEELLVDLDLDLDLTLDRDGRLASLDRLDVNLPSWLTPQLAAQ